MRLKGSCHCGKVKFTVDSAEPVPFMRCYCSICRKTAGAGGYAINLGADARLPQIVTLLDQWDWQQTDVDADGFYDSPAVAVFNTWWQIMTDTTFGDDLGSTFQPNAISWS